jgi:hypothetical protein
MQLSQHSRQTARGLSGGARSRLAFQMAAAPAHTILLQKRRPLATPPAAASADLDADVYCCIVSWFL